MVDDEWTTIRISKSFKDWIVKQGIYDKDKSVFDILVRLVGWNGDK